MVATAGATWRSEQSIPLVEVLPKNVLILNNECTDYGIDQRGYGHFIDVTRFQRLNDFSIDQARLPVAFPRAVVILLAAIEEERPRVADDRFLHLFRHSGNSFLPLDFSHQAIDFGQLQQVCLGCFLLCLHHFSSPNILL